MATNKELTEQVKILKDEVRRLRSEAKTVEAELEGLDGIAHGVIIKDKIFNLVRIKFNEETNKAAIDEVFQKGTGKSLVEVSSYLKKATITALTDLNKRSK